MLHEDLRRFFDGFPRDAHPMPVLSSAVGALSTFYQDSLDPFNPEQVELSTIRLLAKLPTIAAYAYKKSIGQPLLYPDNSLSLIENFLRMSFGFPAEPYEVNPKLAKALDQLLILHADHEQNCSTSTVRLAGSSNANLFASVSAGINALFGPLHGGANQAVLEMLESIRCGGGTVNGFVQRVKNKEPGIKLMGFGHRVYKNYDPRAALVKTTAHEVLDDLGGDDELLDLAQQLEEVALSDEYFITRSLYPNVDFYTGLIYKAMGFPTRMFTVLFALGRLPGWIAQWREMINDPATKIGRPRQVYTGYTDATTSRQQIASLGADYVGHCRNRYDACLRSGTSRLEASQRDGYRGSVDRRMNRFHRRYCASARGLPRRQCPVGPGPGLTTLALARRVTAVEIDRELTPMARERTRSCGNVKVVEGDATACHSMTRGSALSPA